MKILIRTILFVVVVLNVHLISDYAASGGYWLSLAWATNLLVGMRNAWKGETA